MDMFINILPQDVAQSHLPVVCLVWPSELDDVIVIYNKNNLAAQSHHNVYVKIPKCLLYLYLSEL